jgi:hypothetical protein
MHNLAVWAQPPEDAANASLAIELSPDDSPVRPIPVTHPVVLQKRAPSIASASGRVRHGTSNLLQIPGIVRSHLTVGTPLKERPSYVTTVRPRCFASAMTNGSAPSRRGFPLVKCM